LDRGLGLGSAGRKHAHRSDEGCSGDQCDEAFPAVEHERKDSLAVSYAYQVS
jgi:hypothetical protein